MDSIDPIDHSHPAFGVGNNPYLLEYLSHQVEKSSANNAERLEASVEATKMASNAPINPDKMRLSQDPVYLSSTLAYMLERARYYFQAGYLEDAKKNYQEYLSYQHFYGQGYEGVDQDYFQVLFEYSWLLDINNERKESERVLNEELLRQLEEITKASSKETPHRAEVRQFIQTLQELDEFPNNNRLREPVSTDILFKLVKKLVTHEEPELARAILGGVEVRNLLAVFRTERWLASLNHQLDPREGLQSSLLPIIYTRIGLPFAPVNPLAHDEDKRVFAKEYRPEILRTSEVFKVHSIDKDPDQDSEREKRRKKQTPPQQGASSIKQSASHASPFSQPPLAKGL
ncbi:MAG: hypothetical protein K2X66_02985, partial [Cyanobacteria bacterium]|nr:hypothetical protein [Cyanobacteriota bacterium]